MQNIINDLAFKRVNTLQYSSNYGCFFPYFIKTMSDLVTCDTFWGKTTPSPYCYGFELRMAVYLYLANEK